MIPLITEETVDSLLRENRNLQAYVGSLIRAIELRFAFADALLRSLRGRDGKRGRANRDAPPGAERDGCFKFCWRSRVFAPPLPVRPPRQSFALAPKYRWNRRATGSLKRQAERMGLDTCSVQDFARWQSVADAINYDSKAAQCVGAIQCFQHYQQAVTASAESFSPAEDFFIQKSAPACGRWAQLVADIFSQFGHRRTVFQLAERCRKLKRDLYEFSGVLDSNTWRTIEPTLLGDRTPGSEVLVDCVCRINAARSIPWVTEESIRKTLANNRSPHNDGDDSLLQNIRAVLLSEEDYASSRAARRIVVRLLGCDPLDIYEPWTRARGRYAQISVEEVAERLAASVPDLRERVLAKVLRWHKSVYASDFFQVSLDLLGQRDGAMACFLIAREYERRGRRIVPYISLQLQ